MKRIFTILVLIIFIILSCRENKSGSAKTDDTKIENNTETKNEKLETSDTLNSYNYSDLDNQTKYTKELDLFWIRDLEENANKKVGFVSLSDTYPLSEHPDSLAIPNLEDADINSLKYSKLNVSYRKRFLTNTNISETDSLFIYDYSKDVLLSFSIRKLNVVAYLNDYMDIKDCPCTQSDYMIGFEVNKNYLIELGKSFNESLVYIGKKNPFIQGKMKPIVWKKIKTEKFPSEKSNLTEMEKQNQHKNTVKGQAYLYETDLYQVFIQDYKNPEDEYFYATKDRHLIVINKQSKKAENEMLFSVSEGTTLAPLNFGIDGNNFNKIQWTGQLFKNKSEVFFGFEWISFGCPIINFLNSRVKYVQINCDNRH